MKIIENSECLKEFGQFIRSKRETLGLYQSDVASRLGVSQVYYSQIECGKRNTDLVLALKICQILNLNLSDYIKEYL